MAARTLWLLFHRRCFLDRMLQEVDKLQAFCRRHDYHPALRLNGTSDRPWESRKYGRLLQAILYTFPQAQIYDYTKHFVRATAAYRQSRGVAPYHVTFSYSGSNWRSCRRLLDEGVNVAVPFAGPLPQQWRGYQVHDGDRHDLRFLDPTPRVVALRFKTVLDGKGSTVKLADVSDFVVTEQADYDRSPTIAA